MIEYQDWDEIMPERDNTGFIDSAQMKYVDFGGIRTYDGDVYVNLKNGWVLIDEIVDLLEEAVDQ